MFSTSLALRSAALTLSLFSVAGCAIDAYDDEALASEEQALVDDDGDGTTPGGGTTTVYPTMSIELRGISAETRFEDDTFYWGQISSRVLQVYGSISINNLTRGGGMAKNLGTWGNPDWRTATNWTGSDGAAPKLYDTHIGDWSSAPQYLFKDTKLCTSNTYSTCQSSFAINNQVASVPAVVGDTVRINFNFFDYDSASDDQFCQGSVTGIVAKSSTGALYLKASYGGPITSTTGTAQVYVPGSLPNTWSPASLYCKLWIQ